MEMMFKTFTTEELVDVLSEAGHSISKASALKEAETLVDQGLFMKISDGLYAMTAKGMALAPAMLEEPDGHTIQ